MQVIYEEHATLLGFAVVREYAVALFSKAACVLACIIVICLFAVAEEAAVLFALSAPAHAGASVEYADAATRNHDVELALSHVTADVRCHDDELLALDCLGVGVSGVVVAFAGKRELVALAAGTAVTCRYSGECEAHVGTAVNGERNLACAGHHRTACANTSCTPVLAFGLALVCALPGVVRGVCLNRAVGLAAVPVTGGPAGSGFAAVLDNNVRASAGQRLLRAAGRLGGAAGARLCAARRLRLVLDA